MRYSVQSRMACTDVWLDSMHVMPASATTDPGFESVRSANASFVPAGR